MKIQIDTTAKTIKLESCEKLSVLFDFLTNLFPNGDWKDYELQTNTQIVNWGNPIILQHPLIWRNPYQYDQVFCETGTGTYVTSSQSNTVLNFETT